MCMQSKLFSQEEINFLNEFYPKYGTDYCVEKLGRTIYSIRIKVHKLKLNFCGIIFKYHQENLEPIVKVSISYSETLRNMGLKANSGNLSTLKRYINMYKINVDHFDPHKYCKLKLNNLNTKQEISNILVENSTYASSSHLKDRLYKEGLKQRCCELCGQTEEWRGNRMSLILDHINGVSNDNRFENLRIVCPNCNATLDTHCRGSEKLKRKLENQIQKEEHLEKPKKEKKIYKRKKSDVIKMTREEVAKEKSLTKRTVDRPPYEQLKNEINDLGYSATGRKYGVSDNAIRKWIKVYEKYFNESPESELN